MPRSKAMHIGDTLTLGNVLTILVLVAGFVAHWAVTGRRLDELEKWKGEHVSTTEKSIDLGHQNAEAVQGLIRLVSSHEDRIGRVEDALMRTR